jgi:hypothetical protein
MESLVLCGFRADPETKALLFWLLSVMRLVSAAAKTLSVTLVLPIDC